jgi:hypothetical protein
MRQRDSAARDQAIAVAERLTNMYALDLCISDFETLTDLVWMVGTDAARNAFTVAEYEVGSEPESLWCCVIGILRSEAADWGFAA